MPTPREYRAQALWCLYVARSAEEFCVEKAMLDLAADFNRTAEQLERAPTESKPDSGQQR
jgi:hypothetical protein